MNAYSLVTRSSLLAKQQQNDSSWFLNWNQRVLECYQNKNKEEHVHKIRDNTIIVINKGRSIMNEIITTVQNIENKGVSQGAMWNFGFILENKRAHSSNDADVACSVNNNNDKHSSTVMKFPELDVGEENGNDDFLKYILTSLSKHKPQEQSIDWSNHDEAIKFVKSQTSLGTKYSEKSDNVPIPPAKKPHQRCQTESKRLEFQNSGSY